MWGPFEILVTGLVVYAAVYFAVVASVPHLRIVRSARRIGLRDKGALESFVQDDNWTHWVHATCQTRLRVGIDRYTHQPKEYCWRCEKLVELYAQPDPEGKKEDISHPAPPRVPSGEGAQVIPFPVPADPPSSRPVA
jgi:hypothetical protein